MAFTDNHLATIYLKLQKRYREELSRLPFSQIYATLERDIQMELVNPQSSLYGLDALEQYKVWYVFNTFMASCPQYSNLQEHEQRSFRFVTELRTIHVIDSHYHCYCPSNDFLFTWLLLDSLSSRHHHHYHDSGCCFPSSNNHHRHGGSSEDQAKCLLFLLLVLLVTSLIALAALATFYLLLEAADSLERMFWNEGWLKAIISLSSAIASGLVAGFLASNFASAPLMALALAAGVSNPVGMAALGVVCLTIIGTGLGCFITNQIQDAIIKSFNKGSLDPHDPYRFRLTEQEEQNLLSKQPYALDPIKVKCAMVALHEEIGKSVPWRLSRLFCDDEGKQALLEQVRKLRRGEIDGYTITIGKGEDKRTIDLRPFQQYVPTYTTPPQSLYPEQSSPYYGQTPPPSYNPELNPSASYYYQ
ncbi:Uncharacterised protein [Legionella lansingensis]|uniref:Uncharacterized protein n=1 Tax=Legionella lansingensis TaxID=45067 RepID=A0A0W0VKA4_9GAMM|nr:hypothetical protein [Legionella lansingensis]KTD20545.1 hypothetical protein Llan_1798 [Legionella lansingensis]SNV47691.1 Uncharacterised protein [Legionella lansingensis]